MGHKPYESWLVAEEPLLPDQEMKLQKHLNSCESCRQISTSWQELQVVFGDLSLAKPAPGFTERWQARFADDIAQEMERGERRSTWYFLAFTTGAAFLIFVIMLIKFFSSVQAPTQVFISGMTLIAGLLNLTQAMQVASMPLLEVILVSVPTLWWLILALCACLLTITMTYSAFKFLYPRRVSQ